MVFHTTVQTQAARREEVSAQQQQPGGSRTAADIGFRRHNGIGDCKRVNFLIAGCNVCPTALLQESARQECRISSRIIYERVW